MTRVSTATESTLAIADSEALLVLNTRFAGEVGRVGEAESKGGIFRSFLLVDIGLAISVGVGACVSI